MRGSDVRSSKAKVGAGWSCGEVYVRDKYIKQAVRRVVMSSSICLEPQRLLIIIVYLTGAIHTDYNPVFDYFFHNNGQYQSARSCSEVAGQRDG